MPSQAGIAEMMAPTSQTPRITDGVHSDERTRAIDQAAACRGSRGVGIR
jgi:hypothetical protein